MVLNEFGKIAYDEWVKTADCIRPNVTNINDVDVVKEGECNSPLRGTSQKIGAIVRGYKSAVTKRINCSKSIWQRNYYEHIIRTENSYQLIADYILTNPAKWLEDKLYVK